MTSYGFKYGALGFFGGVLGTVLVVVLLSMYTDVFTSNQPVVTTNTNTAPVEDVISNDFADTRWYLADVDGEAVKSASYIEFLTDGSVEGFDGCNSFRGTYTLTGDTLELSPLVSTLKFCADVAEVDATFLTTAETFTAIEVVDDMLVITGTSGTFSFTATEPVAEEVEEEVVAENGIIATWDLVEVVVNGEGEEVITSGVPYSFTFTEDDEINGAICNTLNGSYTTGGGEDINADTVTMSDFTSTRKQCAEPAGIMDLEDTVLAYLAETTRYEVDGANLTVYFGEAEDYMVFTLSAADETEDVAADDEVSEEE